MPQVSVLMPMKNAEKYIRKTLDSVLSQEGVDLEVLVCDDASTDRSVELIEQLQDPRIVMLRNPGSGIASGLNHCLEKARGQVVMRCDADDLYPPGRVKRQLELLEQHPECGVVCGICQTIDDNDRPVTELTIEDHGHEITEEMMTDEMRVGMLSYAIRTEALRQIGCARPYFVVAEDIDAQYRLAEACRVWYEPEVFYLYRLNPQSVIHSTRNDFVMFFVNTARVFHEQRIATGQDDLQRGCPPEPPPKPEGDVLTARRHESDLLTGAAWEAYDKGRKGEGLRLAVRALRVTPCRMQAWRNVLVMLLKLPF